MSAPPPTPSHQPILVVRNLTVRIDDSYHAFHAVDNLSFQIDKGQTLALLGESGSGKTLTALALLELLPKRANRIAGEIYWRGQMISRAEIGTAATHDRLALRGKGVAMVFQNPHTALNPVFRIGHQMTDVVRTHLKLSKKSAKAKVLELLQKVGMKDPERTFRAYPHQLSGGMAQRVVIAMALSCQPQLIIADEPTTALDVTTQHQILGLISRLQAEYHFSLLLISHDLDVVAKLADRTVVLRAGKMVEEGTTEAILSGANEPYTQSLVEARLPAAVSGGSSKPVPSRPTFLQVRNLTKSFWTNNGLLSRRERKLAVDNLSLDLHAGEFLALVGESGSGKTTLGRCILRLTRSDQGQIWRNGEDLLSFGESAFRRLRPRLQMIFQDPSQALNPRQSVGATLSEPLKVWRQTRGQELARRVKELLTLVGLESKLLTRFPNELSGGQKQRVAIARALSTEPEFVIADEPTSSLDASSKKQIVSLLRELQTQLELTLLLISHDLALVAEVSDRTAVLYGGRLVEIAPTERLISQPRHPYTQSLLGAIASSDRTHEPPSLSVTSVHSVETNLDGCVFSQGCPWTEARCRKESPLLVSIDQEHKVACHLQERLMQDTIAQVQIVPGAEPVSAAKSEKPSCYPS